MKGSSLDEERSRVEQANNPQVVERLRQIHSAADTDLLYLPGLGGTSGSPGRTMEARLAESIAVSFLVGGDEVSRAFAGIVAGITAFLHRFGSTAKFPLLLSRTVTRLYAPRTIVADLPSWTCVNSTLSPAASFEQVWSAKYRHLRQIGECMVFASAVEKVFPLVHVSSGLGPELELVAIDFRERREAELGDLWEPHHSNPGATPQPTVVFSVERDGNEWMIRVSSVASGSRWRGFEGNVNLQRLLTFLRDAKRNMYISVAKLSVMSKWDLDIINRANQTHHELPERTFNSRFWEVVGERGAAVAVVDGTKTVSYSELADLVMYNSERLSDAGVTNGCLVAIHTRRGLELLVSILATWECGAGYLPLDPNYPTDRKNVMLHESRANHLLLDGGDRSLGDSCSLSSSVVVVDPRVAIPTEGVDRRPPTSPQDLAYVLFTSGSTGTPKGVMVSQDGMMNHMKVMIDFFGLDSECRISQTASQCFDISVWQLLCALLVGGTTVFIDQDDILSPRRFFSCLRDYKITLTQLVPSYLKLLIDEAKREGSDSPVLPSLRDLITTGEQIRMDSLLAWHRCFCDIRVTNAYGPAEASDDTNLYKVDFNELGPTDPVPIGPPVANVEIEIESEAGVLCPVGWPGELKIVGRSVGLGYTNPPSEQETPFSQNAKGQRTYRTGDYGHWTATGDIVFDGRKDGQVKIRGARVELDEVELVSTRMAGVVDAAAIVHNQDHESVSIHLFFVSSRPIATAEYRRFLGSQLPPSHVPTFYQQVNELPKNNNGKIDRMAIRAKFLAGFS